MPNSLITQLHYGNLDNFQGSQEVTVEGGKIYSIFSELLPTENGDYIYTKTDQTDKLTNSNGIPIALIRDYTYVVVDPLQSDPSLQKTVLYIRSLNGADSSTYGININESPVGLWWKTQMQTDVAEMSYGGQIIPNLAIVSSSPTHRDFYFPIFPVNYADPICGNQIDQIIKATIVTATGEISFERIGPFGLGNGAGRHRLTDNIFLSSGLSTYFSLYISANPPSGELTMLKLPVAYQWGGLLNSGILQVKEDFRGQGIGAKLVARRIKEAYKKDECILKIQCQPSTSIPFWKKMGFTIFTERHDNYAYRILEKTFPLPVDGISVNVIIRFYPEDRKWSDALIEPIECFSPPSVMTMDNVIHLSKRVSFFEDAYRKNTDRDVVVEIEVDGNFIYFDKAKYSEAQYRGMKRCRNGFYIDKVQPLPTD